MMRYALITLVLFLLGIGSYLIVYYFGACIARGGSAKHKPPSIVYFNQTMNLEFELTEWGAAQCLPESLKNSYEDVGCHYKLNNENEFTSLKPEITREYKDQNGAHIIYLCRIPAITKQQDVKSIEYYFDLKSNGNYSKIVEEPILFAE